MSKESQHVLDNAYDELESELPDRVARAVRWLRAPKRRWLRISIGALFVIAGCLWFLPVVGLEYIPIGLLFLAQDIPFLQRPIGHAIVWTVHKYRALATWWRARRMRQKSGGSSR